MSLTWILGLWSVDSGWTQDKSGESIGTNAHAERLLDLRGEPARAAFSLAELEPELTDRVILLADTKDGQPLPPREGPFRIIVPGEKRPTRWVRQVSAVTVHRN